VPGDDIVVDHRSAGQDYALQFLGWAVEIAQILPVWHHVDALFRRIDDELRGIPRVIRNGTEE